MKQLYMVVDDICALSFHEMWDGRESYYTPGTDLSPSRLRKWLGLGIVKGERFASNNQYGYTWGVPVTEIPKIRNLYNNPPDVSSFPKISHTSEGFITWREYMDDHKEYHV